MQNTMYEQVKAQKELGIQGEDQVVQYLCSLGFVIKERNYRKKLGEIDIVAAKDNVYAFVEVKLRSKKQFNFSQVISRSKQRKIINTAQLYIMQHKLSSATTVLRFDTALVSSSDTNGNQNQWDLTYIPNAFTSHDHWV